MTRSTKTIETPIEKHKIVVYEYLTGGDKRVIISAGEDRDSQLNAMVKSLIVSVDGITEDILQQIDNMHGKDFDFIFTELTKIIEDSNLSPEKKSS